jgi:DNA helicase-2/ATP-dependent DNA helicase PcrA
MAFPQEILYSTASKIALIAAPGCGKTTRVLIPKAKEILEDTKIDPSEVLLLTFSRLTALDLKNKIRTMDRAPKASTVHSFCLSFLLSENDHEIRKRVECVLLEFQKEVLLSDLKLVFEDRNKKLLRKTLREFSAAWAVHPHDQTFEEAGFRKAFKNAVLRWLEQYQAVLMEEIIYSAVHLARQLDSTEFLEKPKYIFVDEYQDLNKLEQEFIDILANKSERLLIVGDPDQSVYGFKHAHHSGIVEFSNRADVEAFSHPVTGRCPKEIVKRANELLSQANPSREELLECKEGQIDGEVHFIQQNTQEMEFDSVLERIARLLNQGCEPEQIIVLSPKQPLAFEFAKYAEDRKNVHGVSNNVDFVVTLRPVFTDLAQDKILRLALLVSPNSLAHIRCYAGIGDENHYAKVVSELKDKYGGMREVLENAREEDWPNTHSRVKLVCKRLRELRGFLNEFRNSESAEAVIDALFSDDSELQTVRQMFESLLEPGDTPKQLYDKFIDYIRSVSTKSTSVRVMTLMASKGLEANHVFIIGCNSGNIPGERRIDHMSDLDHRNEQRRLLYVGFTRAKQTLTVSWSRSISFQQSKRHHTKGIRIWRAKKQRPVSTLGICDFLGDLSDVQWEN